ncbi:MAG TPA: LysR family transcriptional regulator [Sphingobium sp.]
MDIAINLLRYFALTAELKSFTMAATRLRTSQAVISNGVSRLEKTLGFRLLERDPRDVRLTNEGQALLPEALALIAACDAADVALIGLAADRPAILRFGYPPYMTDVPQLDAVLDKFLATYPTVSIEIEILLSSGLFVEVRQRRLDCALVLGPPDAEAGAFDTLLLDRLATSLFLPEEHPLAAGASVPLAALKGVEVLSPDRHEAPYFFDLALAPLEAAGVRLVHAKNPTFLGLYHAARRERRLSIGFDTLISDEQLTAGRLVLRPIAPSVGGVDLMLIRAHGSISPVLSDLWEFMKAQSFA